MLAYGSFLVAEDFHASGVLSTLTAGILIGNFGLPTAYSDKGRTFIMDFLGIHLSLVFSMSKLKIEKKNINTSSSGVDYAALWHWPSH